MENILKIGQFMLSNPIFLLSIIALLLGREISFGSLKIGGRKPDDRKDSEPEPVYSEPVYLNLEYPTIDYSEPESLEETYISSIKNSYNHVKNFIGSVVLTTSFLIVIGALIFMIIEFIQDRNALPAPPKQFVTQGNIDSIQLDRYCLEHQSQRGTCIYLSWNVDNLKNNECMIIVYFLLQKKDGKKYYLTSYHDSYRSKDDILSVGKSFTPATNKQEPFYETFFIPEDVLGLKEHEYTNLTCYAVLYNSLTKTFFSESEYAKFSY